MTIVKWKPMRQLTSTGLFDEMDAWMDQVFNRRPIVSHGSDTWMPAFAVHESDTEYLVTADIPGLEKKEINISLQEKILTVSGERKNSTEDKANHYCEIQYGKFSRSFNLPEDVKGDDIQAKFKNGVLTLSIPKTQEVKPEVKKITIK